VAISSYDRHFAVPTVTLCFPCATIRNRPRLVTEAVGHSDLRTTMSYTHSAREHLRGLIDAPARPARQGRNRNH
jgi:hypothetical protein